MPSKSTAKTELTLASGVTSESFAKLGSAFVAARGGGFLIALANGESQGQKYTQTLKPWGAWLAYRKRKKLPLAAMNIARYFTVPAEWPHLFDADTWEPEDNMAGAEFETRWLNLPRALVGIPPKPRIYHSMAEAAVAVHNLATDAAFGFFRPPAQEQKPFRPFPQLWGAFSNDSEAVAWLDAGGWSFDTLSQAAKLAVNRGAADAATFLENNRAALPKAARAAAAARRNPEPEPAIPEEF